MDWFDKAENELCEQLNNGEITEKEFREEMRGLNNEMRAGAEEAASNAYNDYWGNY